MGQGLALQCASTPGIRMVAAIDIDVRRAEQAAELHGRPWTIASSGAETRAALRAGKTIVASDAAAVLAEGREAVDVMIESTSSVAAAARAVDAALRAKIDVVLMNAEVDCLLGPSLHRTARECGAIVTSDAGDQHGVLMRMIDEVQLWGFELVMAGNIKGFLDRGATRHRSRTKPASGTSIPSCALRTRTDEAEHRDGLGRECDRASACERGMLGPEAAHVTEVFEKFDLPSSARAGSRRLHPRRRTGWGSLCDRLLRCPAQREYLSYYKMGSGPFYLFYRPYHLCHLESSYALAGLPIERRPVFVPLDEQVVEVIAIAKTDLAAGTVLDRAIGGDHIYGEVEQRTIANSIGAVPICLLELEERNAARITRDVSMGAPILWDDIELPESDLVTAYRPTGASAATPRG